jgi:hypothetical protein
LNFAKLKKKSIKILRRINMVEELKDDKTEEDDKMELFPDVCTEFANLRIDEPLLWNDYGKVRSKRGCILEKDIKGERIKDILDKLQL